MVLKDQNLLNILEPDEINLPLESEEGFDRADFRSEFSPSPNLENPRIQTHIDDTRNIQEPTESTAAPKARINDDGKNYKNLIFL